MGQQVSSTESRNRGRVVILSQERFEGTWQTTREGNQRDVDRILDTCNKIGYECSHYKDRTTGQIKTILDALQEEDFTHFECLTVVVLTHGHRKGKLCAHEENGFFKTKDIWERFENVETLKGKLKLFIFQACRGDKHEVVVTGGPSNNPPNASISQNSRDQTVEWIPQLPRSRDTVISFSTMEGCFSKRSETTGSWFIENFCAEVNDPRDRDLLDVLTRITNFVTIQRAFNKAQGSETVLNFQPENENGQTPCYFSFLTRDLQIPKCINANVEGNTTTPTAPQSNNTGEISTNESTANLRNDASVDNTDENSYEIENICAIIIHTASYKAQAKEFEEQLKKLNNFTVVIKQRDPYEIDDCISQTVRNDPRLSNPKTMLLVLVFSAIHEVKCPKDESLSCLSVTDKRSDLRSMWNLFKGKNCPKLLGNPKVFLFLDPNDEGSQRDSAKKVVDNLEESSNKTTATTDHADFLIGIGFGQEYCTNLKQELQQSSSSSSIEKNLVKILTRAQNIKSCNPERYPYFISTLRLQIKLIFEEGGIQNGNAQLPPRPLQLLIPRGEGFEMNLEALRSVVEHREIKNRSIIVVTIVGAFRRGKTFLMDLILRYLQRNREEDWFEGDMLETLGGFEWGDGSEDVTKGMWIWSQAFPIGRDRAVILVDTQGLYSKDVPMEVNNFLHALSVNMSSFLIINTYEQIQPNDFAAIQRYKEYGDAITHHCHGKPFQCLTFLVRDWEFPQEFEYGFGGGVKYLQSRMKEGSNASASSVSTCFREHQCFLLPPPQNQNFSSNQNIQEIREAMGVELIKMMKILMECVLKRALETPLMQMNGESIPGKKYTNRFQTLVTKLEKGSDNLIDLLPPQYLIQRETIERKNSLLIYTELIMKCYPTIRSTKQWTSQVDQARKYALDHYKHMNEKFGRTQTELWEKGQSKLIQDIENIDISDYLQSIEKSRSSYLQEQTNEIAMKYREELGQCSQDEPKKLYFRAIYTKKYETYLQEFDLSQEEFKEWMHKHMKNLEKEDKEFEDEMKMDLQKDEMVEE